MLGDRHRFSAGQVDQSAEAVLRVFRAQGFHGVIPAILSAISAKLAQDAIAAVARDVRSEAFRCSRRNFYGCSNGLGIALALVAGPTGPENSGTAANVSLCSGSSGTCGGSTLYPMARAMTVEACAAASRTQGPGEEDLRSVLRDGEAELGQVSINDGEAVSSGFFSRKVRRTVRSLMVAWMRMGMSPLSVSSVAVRSKGTKRRFLGDNAARAGDRGLGPIQA